MLDSDLAALYETETKRKVNEIYFNGQIYDAYADNSALDIIKRLTVDVVIVTKPNNLLTSQDIMKYNQQYSNLRVVFDNTFHDRYFIIDNKDIYHCWSSINRKNVCNLLINAVNKII